MGRYLWSSQVRRVVRRVVINIFDTKSLQAREIYKIPGERTAKGFVINIHFN